MHWSFIECYNNQQFTSYYQKNQIYYFITPRYIVGAIYVGREPVAKNPIFAVNTTDLELMTTLGPISTYNDSEMFYNLKFRYYANALNLGFEFDYLPEEVTSFNTISTITYSDSGSSVWSINPTSISLNLNTLESEVVTLTITNTDIRDTPVLPNSTNGFLLYSGTTSNYVQFSSNYSNLEEQFVVFENWQFTNFSHNPNTGVSVYTIEFLVHNYSAPNPVSETITISGYLESNYYSTSIDISVS